MKPYASLERLRRPKPTEHQSIEDITAQTIFAVKPLTLNRRDALRYTGIAEKLFDQLERSGSLKGHRWGRNGSIIFHRDDLDRVVGNLFGFNIHERIEL